MEWINEGMNRWLSGWLMDQMNEWMHECTEGLMTELMDGGMDEWQK